MILTDVKERNRFIKFALVGSLGSVIDFAAMNLLSHWAGLSLVLAGTISFVCAVLNNFTWNRVWTYPESRSRPLVSQLGMFFIVNVAGIAIRAPILHFGEPLLLRFVENVFHTSHVTAEFYAKNLTLAAAIGIVMMWNFFVNRYWTYSNIDNEEMAI
jgi:putative flippase GtrA